VTGEPASERRHHTLIPERSAVVLNVRTSLGPISFGADGIEGFIEVAVWDDGIEAGGAAAAHLELLVARLTSGNSAYDSELRRQIDGRRFPTAYVDLHTITPLDQKSSSFQVRGEVTLRGVTVPATGVVVVELPEPGLIAVSGEDTLNISDFGIPPPSLFMIKIDPEVKLRLHLEARAEPA
jgi:polyisoprenoid-binding protein YceI